MATTRAALDRRAARLIRKPEPLGKSVTIRITEPMWRAIELEAAESECRTTDVLRTAVLSYLLAHQPAEFDIVDDHDGHTQR